MSTETIISPASVGPPSVHATDPLLVKRALDRASVLHFGQLRKYPGVEVPYVSHIAGVAAILSRHGFDDEVIAAGVLHDVVEDCGVALSALEAEFGPRVATLVDHVSEQDRTMSWEDRKRIYLERFPHKPWEAQAITLADKIDNFQSIVVARTLYGDPWSLFKRGKAEQLGRFDVLASMLAGLPPHPIVDEYREWLERIRAV